MYYMYIHALYAQNVMLSNDVGPHNLLSNDHMIDSEWCMMCNHWPN